MNYKIIEEYMAYFKKYYGAEFRPNQGLDEITDMIDRYSVAGTWIDLGGGTSTFIWLPAFNNISRVYSFDKYAESAYVQAQVRFMKPSDCYHHILDRYNKTIDEMNKIHISYSQVDLFKDFPYEIKSDNVSQFGLLGLCKTKRDYLDHLKKLTAFMNTESVFLGANWIFSNEYAKRCGFENSYIDVPLIEEYVRHDKKELLYVEKISIENDPCYIAVLIYAFKSLNV